MPAVQWEGEGMSQDDFMKKDECIVLDENDQIIGQDNKYNCHRFNPAQPRGVLHRAFSVFLFDSQGRLLLQQRASTKITFRNVWTNSCCSHPLSGYTPTESDTPANLASGTVLGVKRAAIRKLKHELGIPASQIPIEKFKFLTRLHYWAADTVTHGPQSEWGEHEIDYILFIQADVTVKPNPEEVDDYKYVTLKELQKLMAPSSGLLWSPWFRIIVERFLPPWWADLKTTFTTDKYVDVKSIHRFDPLKEHMGGGGNAGPWLDLKQAASSPSNTNRDMTKKQGAYGKIKTHSESLVSQLLRVNEVMAALRVRFFSPFKEQVVEENEDLAFCNEILGKVSRSFAAVIRQLPAGLCVETVVFYLVLRALDTVEDDMEAFDDPMIKIKHLQTFYEKALEDPTWSMTGVGKGDEAILLEQFYRVVKVFKGLPKGMQTVIKDITKRMGAGMAEFVSKDLGQGTISLKEYDLYCHYVAGLVGEGLTRMFSESGLEEKQLAERKDLSNSMGLFLQKTNIIRDYLEDYVDSRAFWPQEVWKTYTITGSLGDFAEAKNRDKAIHCLNHLVTNALVHVPDCVDYMSHLHTPEIFRFCAIPQVMAIATLDKVYNNEDVFTGVVKIRKGLACKLILDSTNLQNLHATFAHFASAISRRVAPADPSATRTLQICQQIQELCATATAKERSDAYRTALVVSVVLVPFITAACVYSLSSLDGNALEATNSNLLVLALLFASIVSLLVGGGLTTFMSSSSSSPSSSAPVTAASSTSSSKET